MNFKKFYEKYLFETVGDRGFKYEEKVIAALIEAGIVGNIRSGAGASAAAPDADIKIGKKIYEL